jgi:Lytic transglycolase/Putative peptidoglycan binding domain
MSVPSQNTNFCLTVCYLAATFLLSSRHIPRGSGDPTVGANLRPLPRSAVTSFGASPSANPVSHPKEEMSEGSNRPWGVTEDRPTAPRSLSSRPDRVALWAVILALVAMVAGAASARAGSGGTGTGGGDGGGGDGGACVSAQFGKRALERGDCGSDVETLNWILKAKDYGVPLRPRFRDPTDSSVRAFQRKRGFRSSGVVNERTRKAIVGAMKRHTASWYGPGFWGNRTACGQRLRKTTVGVAHRNLPCGTKVVIGYKGRFLRTRVIDRGPYVKQRYSRDWDLTRAAARRVGFEYTDEVRSVVIK